MRGLLFGVVVFGLLQVPQMAMAQEAPFGFKQYLLGAPLSQFQADPKFKCAQFKRPGRTKCTAIDTRGKVETIAEVPVDYISLDFVDDKLGGAYVTFLNSGFHIVMDGLRQRFTGGKEFRETLQNSFGAKFENIRVLWSRNDSTMAMNRFAGDLKTAGITFRTREFSDVLMREIEEEKQRKAKDL